MSTSSILIIGSVLLFIIIFTILWVIASNNEKKILKEGIKVDSTVCRVIEDWDPNDHRRYYRSFVKYIGNDNLEHEALISARCNLPYGRKVKIKYLPPKYDYAIFISQELEGSDNNEI